MNDSYFRWIDYFHHPIKQNVFFLAGGGGGGVFS